MLIRSQNGEDIVNIDSGKRIRIIKGLKEDSCAICINDERFGWGSIGDYSTKEKAVKVLDKICEQYQYCQECKYIGVGAQIPEFVFQMPQDNDKCFEE